MSRDCTVLVLFGGRSAEHDVSIESAENVRKALEIAGYRIVLIGIDKRGVWRLAPDIRTPEAAWPEVAMLPGSGGQMFILGDPRETTNVDVVFPVVHGPHGEDGSLQGLLRLANVAFVGPSVLSSSLCMDKEFSKLVLNAAGIPTVKSITFDCDNVVNFLTVVDELGSPLFVKPANLGSSIGISKVHDEAEYQKAVECAFRYDTKIIVEKFAQGREIECAVLSADGLITSLPGEIVPKSDSGYYSYDAKYVDNEGASLIFPANLPDEISLKVRSLSLAASRALGCEGMVRVDFFLDASGELLVNELNTIPGFTKISMYPKLWEVSGIPPDELIVYLINHAFSRFYRESRLLSDRHT